MYWIDFNIKVSAQLLRREDHSYLTDYSISKLSLLKDSSLSGKIIWFKVSTKSWTFVSFLLNRVYKSLLQMSRHCKLSDMIWSKYKRLYYWGKLSLVFALFRRGIYLWIWVINRSKVCPLSRVRFLYLKIFICFWFIFLGIFFAISFLRASASFKAEKRIIVFIISAVCSLAFVLNYWASVDLTLSSG